jgi:signal transduction protein with GAF and PtsI domain
MSQKPARKFDLKEFKAISHAISIYEDLDLLINHLAEGTSRTFDAKGCSIMLLDEREDQLVTVSSYGVSDEYLQKGPLFVDEKYCAFVKGEPVFIVDLQNDSRIQYPDAAAKEGINSMLSIPIKFRETRIGLIRIYFANQKGLNEEDIDTLQVMAEHLGVVIENNGLKNFLEKIKISMESLPLRMLEGL